MRSPAHRTCSSRWITVLAVSIVAAGCATSLPPTAFVPSGTPDASSYYRDGKAYTTLEDSVGAVLLTMRPATLADRPFLKLWLRVDNRSDHDFLLDPEEDIFLVRRIEGVKKTKQIRPELRRNLLDLVQGNRREGLALRETILRKTTLFPGETVEGNVYFYFPAPAPWDGARPAASPWDGTVSLSEGGSYTYELTLHLNTPGGSRHVVLKPVPADY